MNSPRQHTVYSGSRAYKTRKIIKSLVAALAAVLLISIFHTGFRLWKSDKSSSPEVLAEAVNHSPQFSPFSVNTQHDQQQQSFSASSAFPVEIQTLVDNGRFTRAKNKLLQLASTAVESEEYQELAELLTHLAEIALLQTNLDTAEVYLTEALDLFNQNNNEIAAAGVYQQFGRLHLIVRARARLASSAYDTLLIARGKISRGEFYSAESALRRAAEDNLSLHRYGAAASAYETLYSGYSREGDHYQAQLAGIEAVKLHASSGRTFDAKVILNKMQQSGLSESDFHDLKAEISLLNQEFKQSVLALGAARDQAQLYNQLQAKGDVVNAWRFRQQADASQAKASTRAQYRSQPDVLVELYKSNFSMNSAKASLQRAQEVYQRHGIDTREVQLLQKQIF